MKMMCPIVHIKSVFKTFGVEILIYRINKVLENQKKVSDQELEKLPDENPYWVQGKLTEKLGVTQPAISVWLYKFGRLNTLHAVKSCIEIISSMDWEIIPPAAYSPDFVSSTYSLFQLLQHYLFNSNFVSPDEVKNSIDEFFIIQKWNSKITRMVVKMYRNWEKLLWRLSDYLFFVINTKVTFERSRINLYT